MSNGVSKRVILYLVIAAVLVLCVYRFSSILSAIALLWNIMFPLALGFIVAYVLNLLVMKYEGLYFPRSRAALAIRTRKPVSIALAFITIVAAILLIMRIVLPQVITAVETLASAIPKAVDIVSAWIVEHRDELPIIAEQIQNIDLDWNNIGKNVANYAISGMGGLISSTVGVASSVISSLFTLIIAISFAVYLLIGKNTLTAQLKRAQKAYMKEHHIKRMNYALAVAHESFSSYISGQCLEALILGSLCTLGMWVFRFPYATTIGIFVGVTALIPTVGAYLGAGAGALLILTADPVKAALFIVYIVILQQLENNFIYPKVVGKSVGLPGIWVLVSVVIGGGLFGVAGMLVGVPFTATVYKLFQAAMRKRLSRKA